MTWSCWTPKVNRTLAESAAEDRAGKGRPLAAFIDALADEDTYR